MRNVSADVITAMDNVRTVNARLTFRDLRLVFADYAITDGSVATNGLWYDSDTWNNGILRVAVVNDPATNYRWFYYQWNPTPGTWGSWVDASVRLSPYSSIALYGNRVFYHKFADGDLYYRDWNGAVWSAEIVFSTSSASIPFAFAPVAAGEVYLRWQLSGPPVTMNVDYVSHLDIPTATLTTWPGRIYGDNQFVTSFDAARLNGVDYIFTTDSNANRGLWLTRVGNCWSEVQPIVPLDVVDGSSLFMLGAVKPVNNKLWITGLLTRDDVVLQVYSYGEGHWSLGRNMYIRSGGMTTKTVDFGGTPLDFTVAPGKFLLASDNRVYYVGLGFCSRADASYLVGYDAAAKKLVTQNFNQAGFAMASNTSGKLTAKMASDIDVTLLTAGTEFDFEAGYGGFYATLGKFEIDNRVQSLHQTGSEVTLLGRSKALKRIGQWSPDASFDYWSQTKQSILPADLTGVVRGSGQWTGTTSLILDDLNQEGFLYSVERPARGMLVKGWFKRNPAADYGPTHGLVLHYYKETAEEAAARLGVEEVDELDLGHNGIVCRYGDTESSGNPGIGVYLLRNNVFTVLTSSSTFTIPDNTNHWLMATFQEGRIRVYYRLATDDTLWTEKIDFAYFVSDELPWKRADQVGRAALYTANPTEYDTCFAFEGESLIVPVHDNSDFPAADTVVVNSERIVYAGKSVNRVITDATPTLTYQLGESQTAHTTLGAVDYSFSNDDQHRYIRQGVTFASDAQLFGVRVYVDKEGSPTNGLELSLYTTPVDSSSPLGHRLGTALVEAADVGSSYGWVSKAFDYPVDVLATGTYWLVLTMKGNTDAVNYYRAKLDAGGGYAGGEFFYFNDDTDTWTEVVGNDMAFGVYGSTYVGDNQLFLSSIAAPTNAGDYLDMGLAVVAGTGEGALFRVLSHVETGNPNMGLFLVDRDPQGVVGPDSEFHLCPTLIVSERGASDTGAAAHLVDTRVNLYRSMSTTLYQLDYYSAEPDLRLEDVVAEIAGKAGIDTVAAQDVSGTKSFSGAGWHWGADQVTRDNVIVKLKKTGAWAGEEIGVATRVTGTPGNEDGVALVLTATHAKYYWILLGSFSLRESIPLNVTPAGWLTFSFYNGHACIWANDGLVAAFYTAYGNPGYACLVCNGTSEVEVDWSEADVRIDNYILDMGTDGVALINELVRERRVFFQDDQYGNLRIFRERDTIPGTYPLTVISGAGNSDDNMVSRLRLVGTEIVEDTEDTLLANYGNVFRLVYSERLESLSDLQKEVARLLSDAACMDTTYTVVGAMDPRVEPNDILPAVLPSGTVNVIADEVTFNLSLEDEDVILDMSIQGHASA